MADIGKDIIERMNPISLNEMDSVKLLNRTDTKFVFEANKLPLILNDAQSTYRVLHVNDNPYQAYKTIYYDTNEKFMYNAHQTGRANRYKIRHRTYQSSGIGFLEVKFKDNKGVTYKSRIAYDNTDGLEQGDAFLTKKTPFSWEDLHPASIVEYTRLTLVNLEGGERVTIDINLHVTNYDNGNKIDLSHLCIIELKREKSKDVSLMGKILRKHRVFKKSMSKYSIGLAAVNDSVRVNTFKKKLRLIDKLKQNQIK